MSFLVFAAALFAVFFVWGLFWPRSQWRVLASWMRRDREAAEPGAAAYGAQRVISGIGVATFITVGTVTGITYVQALPTPEPPVTALQKMWGNAPEPVVVNRVIMGSDAADPSLVAEDILGYQIVDNVNHRPRYLAFLKEYDPPGSDDNILGGDPSLGFAALDSAELVVNVRVKAQCAPMEAVVIETETTVQIGIFSAIPEAVGSAHPGNGYCSGDAMVGPSLLIPINLGADVGERDVQNLDGSSMTRIAEIK
ncbi:hypothetical protein [Homoserinimonas hongtaonis]|uniref:DUF6199 domain-containing protein n=1 Tax=Homoserinimonas hongtaonis TaxID=2079791 RepID=A0A2U1T014_9MICO|nr:hypothetical protein [Salinibacterium hongtaonis]PWB97225.1 hypothetical protein DF220_04805 [Salinibacterium hongtaonis]